MGFLDRLLGREPLQSQPAPYGPPAGANGGQAYPSAQATAYAPPGKSGAEISADDAENQRAIARYQYLLRTASPEDLERVHTEAFAKLSPEQRHQVLTSMSASLPAGEKVASAEPADLARAATRAEMQQPGYMNSTFGQHAAGDQQPQASGGMSMGKVIGGAMIGTIAGVAVTSAASSLFSGFGHSPEGQAIGDSVDYPQDWAAHDAGYEQGLADAQAMGADTPAVDDNDSFFGGGGFFDDAGDDGDGWI